LQILQRYLYREFTGNFLGVTGALAAVLFIYQLGAVLARAAQDQYPKGLVLQLFALGTVENFSLLLPLGVLLGIILGLGRLYHESEMVAARACGFSSRASWWPVMALVLPVALASAWLNLYVAPQAAARRAALTAEAVRAGLAEPFQPGRFRSYEGGRTVVYARNEAADGTMQHVFIRQSDGPVTIATVAQAARRQVAADGLGQTIVLSNGQRVEGSPGSRSFRILDFDELRIPLAAPLPSEHRARLDEQPTLRLVGSPLVSERAELQWRMGLPLMVLVAGACAVPLGRLRPRQGRYSRVWLAVLLFAAYGQLSAAARTWYERGTLPAALGSWWVHGAFMLLAAWLLFAGPARRALRRGLARGRA
jgi:lipopolysaccharide export system permease protein